MKRTNFSSGSKWQYIVGYSRAVRIGNMIEINGTVASDENGKVVGENSLYEQTKYILQKIETVLIQAGGSMKDVYKTRVFVTDISRWEEFGKAHAEFFHTIKPCCTLVEVSALIQPEYLVEIEATAITENQ